MIFICYGIFQNLHDTTNHNGYQPWFELLVKWCTHFKLTLKLTYKILQTFWFTLPLSFIIVVFVYSKGTKFYLCAPYYWPGAVNNLEYRHLVMVQWFSSQTRMSVTNEFDSYKLLYICVFGPNLSVWISS